jgi:hypothetical protein
MSDLEESSMAPETPAPSVSGAMLSLPPELETLPAEVKSSMFSLMMGLFVRSTTGPDPESSRVAAQAEMHEETCRLDGYKESLKTRDRQSERDHEFRKKSLNHATALSLLITIACIGGIACGLYLLIVKREQTHGSGLLIASFMALLSGGKSILEKDKD